MKEDRNLFWIVIGYSIGLILIIAALSYLLWNQNDPRIVYVPVSILEWGFIGGMVGVLYRLAFKRSGHRNNAQLYRWIIAKPIVSVVMGAIVYFLAVSGELALNGRTQINNIEFLNVIAFLGGFSDRFSIDLLNRIVGAESWERSDPE
jgi:archaellum biogenesis protein FlaJ (TadC family)